MFKNYLKIAWRNLNKNRAFSIINILGLTIGITVCMMIYIFIMHEFSIDDLHANRKNIYRVMRSFDPSKPATSYLSPAYGPALRNDYPDDISKSVRVMPASLLITVGDKSFREKKVYATDRDFFELFTFPLVEGNKSTVLNEPGSVVLSESTAKKYFGTAEAAMGKMITADKETNVRVTGVFKDFPSDTHLYADLIYPIKAHEHEDWFKIWINNNGFLYVHLNNPGNKAKLEKSFPAFMQKYMGQDMKRLNMKFNLSLTPMKDIYFEKHGAFDNVKHGDLNVVFIFISVAALILLIACINFMNLSTIRAMERSKEVGLRKVMGALRKNLIWQFIGESILLTVISCVLALCILKLAMPAYSNLLGYELAVTWTSPYIYLFLAGVIVVAGFLAGSYPAFFLSSFSPIESLKGKLRIGKAGSVFRQGLVIVQFSISVFLIITTITIINQMAYVKNKQLGYNQEQAIIIPLDNGDIYNNRNAFRTELLNYAEVHSVSMMSGEPGGFFDLNSFNVEGQPEGWKARTMFSDLHLVNNLGLKIIAGRDFSPAFKTDSAQGALINRTAAGALGFTPDEAIGKWIQHKLRDTERRRIVGVVEDFNFLSLKEKMDPLVITSGDDHRVALIRLKGNNITASIRKIKNLYSRIAPVFPFEYTFLDQKFEVLYWNDLRQQTILGIFAGLAIFIACLGLFGLASYTAGRRIKEIGVRKVLGSSVQAIVLLLSRDLLKPVLIATLVATPVAYYAMSRWLENFAYNTGLNAWVFVLACIITIIIALVTISLKAVRAALMNPVHSLRSE
ncbi:MAG: ABC transporter permease [Chitinophagaceae bacterium]|nr:MAG: ABC transporter permease [Chitinophagaceae bacterium]